MSWRHRGGVEVWLHSVWTSAPDGSEWSRHSPVALSPTKNPGRLPLEMEAGWAPESVWMCSEVKKSRTGIRAAIRAACNPIALTTTIPPAPPQHLDSFPWGGVGVVYSLSKWQRAGRIVYRPRPSPVQAWEWTQLSQVSRNSHTQKGGINRWNIRCMSRWIMNEWMDGWMNEWNYVYRFIFMIIYERI
jgi:hypothetical protein